MAGADPALRVLLVGERAQAAVWQQTLEDMHMTYGKDFVTALGGTELLPALDLDYLLAPEEDLAVKKAKAQVQPAKISLSADEKSCFVRKSNFGKRGANMIIYPFPRA